MTRLKEKYNKEVVPELMAKQGYKNRMQVPKLVKVVLNMGMGESIANPKAMEAAEKDLTAIAGQHVMITKAKRAIAAFKVRKGLPIGLMVTLRGKRMYEFLDKFISIVLPRIRDFQGVPRDAFDGQGNYALGFKEQIVFPEIEYDKVDKVRGLQIVIVTTGKNDEEGRQLLLALGMPFAKS
jgi:large subunit ribosomal protein L5